MANRDEYIAKVKTKVDEWNTEIGHLENKARQSEVGARLKYDAQVQQLRHRREEIEKKLAAIQQCDEKTWLDLREGLDKAWRALDDSFRKVRSSFI